MLVLLMTAVSGAWAQTEELLTTITMSGNGIIAYSVSGRATLSTSGLVETGMVAPEVYGWSNSSPLEIGSVTITAAEGYEITKVVFWNYQFMAGYNGDITDTASPFTCYLKGSMRSLNEDMSSGSSGNIGKIEVYGYAAAPAASTYTVTLKEGTEDATSWTIAPAEATTTGVAAGTEVKATYGGTKKVKSVKAVKKAKPAATVTTAPTAKTGVKAGEDVAIVNEGTAEGGTMMYMVNATQPASTDGFSATVPTAEGLTAGTYYVWYYVKADDSHTDSEISATGIEVTIAPDDRGKLICTDGHIHAYGEDAECTAARVAMIVYVGPTGHATYSHGLALALTDEAGMMAWEAAKTACNNKNTSTPVTGATWLLASKDQWNYMLGADGAGSYTALRDGFSGISGASNLQAYAYWSSTEDEGDSSKVWQLYFADGWEGWYNEGKGYDLLVRACLAF